ncbi:hypothetical protein PAMP_004850 [Pampus punctatissimus]
MNYKAGTKRVIKISVGVGITTGEHLLICPWGYTCCTTKMEENLTALSRKEMEEVLKDAGRSLQTSLTGHYKTFDGKHSDIAPCTSGCV